MLGLVGRTSSSSGRRVYTQSHMDYVAEVLLYLDTMKAGIRGVRIVEQPPALRHFTARFELA